MKLKLWMSKNRISNNLSTNLKTIRLGDMTNFPKRGAKLKVHYDVFLLNNSKKIESSRDEKEPFEFMLGRDEVIEAWEQVLVGMSIGQKVSFEVDVEHVFGSMVSNSVRGEKVVFIIELLSFI